MARTATSADLESELVQSEFTNGPPKIKLRLQVNSTPFDGRLNVRSLMRHYHRGEQLSIDWNSLGRIPQLDWEGVSKPIDGSD